MAAKGTGTLIFIDDFTADSSSRMNAEVWRNIVCAQIQSNASKLIGQHFIIPQGNDPKHTITATRRAFHCEEVEYV